MIGNWYSKKKTQNTRLWMFSPDELSGGKQNVKKSNIENIYIAHYLPQCILFSVSFFIA
jgi:hypothetical protein